MKQYLYCLVALLSIGFYSSLTAQTSHTVAMLDDVFQPADITINEGDTIIWVNEGNNIHTATSGSDCTYDGTWDSGNISSGESYSHVFTETGNNPYFCIPHCGIGMVGSVTIEDATAVNEPAFVSSDVSVSPNPARTQTRISIETDAYSNVDISFFDLTGKQIKLPHEKAREGSKQIAYDLYLGGLNQGVYFVQLSHKGTVQTTRRLIVQ